MPNVGKYPLDPISSAGQLRILVGDVSAKPLVPDVPGFADFAVFSDADLAAALLASGSSPLRAAGSLYRSLAAQYTMSGRSIKTDDLAIDTRNRGKDLLEVAQSFFDEADSVDAATASDFFQVVPFGGRSPEGRPRVEGSPWPLLTLPVGASTQAGAGYGNGGYGE